MLHRAKEGGMALSAYIRDGRPALTHEFRVLLCACEISPASCAELWRRIGLSCKSSIPLASAYCTASRARVPRQTSGLITASETNTSVIMILLSVRVRG